MFSFIMLGRLCALTLVSFFVAACGSNPSNLTCPTKAQSLQYIAGGSCSGGTSTAVVTIATQPGLCALTVTNGEALGYDDFQGQFTGMASATNYDLTMGNWQLTVQEGNTSEGSTEIHCDIVSITSAGAVTLACSGSICAADDCSGSGSCSFPDCMETLTPTAK
jgi:hypothetical protein